MNDFEKLAYDEIRAALGNIEDGAIPIFMRFRFMFSILTMIRAARFFNWAITHSHLTACTPAERQAPGWPVASSPAEAKWNYAFWLQNELTFIGDPDTEGGRLLEVFLKSQGLWYSDEEEDVEFERCMQIAEQITTCFVERCVRIAQALHETGIIEQRFHRPIPIIVHELEYYDQIAKQNRAANPPGLTQEFEDWIDCM